MQLVLATLQNRPIVYKMIRFDSADPKTRKAVETIYVSSLADAKDVAGDDWYVGKAIGLEGREFQTGDIIEKDNSDIVIVTGSGSRVSFDANEYTGMLPNISVDQSVLNAITYKPNQPRIQSIVNGEMTLWQ